MRGIFCLKKIDSVQFFYLHSSDVRNWIFTQGRHWRNLLVKTKVCLVEVCLLAFFKCFFLLKLKFFFKNKPPEKITLRHIVYLHLSELLYMAFFLQTFEIINKKIAINTDTLINSTDDGLSWRSQSECSNKCFRILEICFCEISF